MSQPPPPPPNQPPPGSAGGGFGAPQDPPPGGTPAPGYGTPPAGYPQQPGQQPGYGYPQQPGQQPQMPPTPPPAPPSAPHTPPPAPPQTPPPGAGGYGYPGQSPVHAQPTQAGVPTPYPSGQQQYPSGQQYGYPPQGQYPGGGYPGAPGGPGAPGPGDGGGKSKQRMMIIVSAVVAVALIVGGGIWFATKDGGDDNEAKKQDKTSQGSTGGKETGGSTGGKDVPAPATVNARLINKIAMPKVKEQVTVQGMWATSETFAKADVNKLVGYPLDGGKSKWTVPLSGAICWSSAHVTEDNMTAVVFSDTKTGLSCSEVGLVDLAAGKMVWTKHASDGDEKIRFDEVTVGNGVVAAGGTSGGAAWSMDGKQLWKPGADEDCSDSGYAAGPTKLVAVVSCGEYDDPVLKVQTIDPKTKKATSTFKLPPGIEYAHVASTDPLVIGFDAGDSTGSAVSDFMTIDDSAKTGKLISKIGLHNGKYIAKCETTNVEGCTEMAINKSAGTLFMTTEERNSYGDDAGTSNEVVAFSLKTGKLIGKADGVKGAALTVLGLDKDGYVLAYQESNYDAGGAVWRIDPKSYEKDKLLQNPAASHDMESKFSPDYQEFIYSNKRLYMGDVYATKPSGTYDKDDPLAVIFGG